MNALSDHFKHEHRNLELHLDGMLATAHAVGSAPHPVLRDMTDSVLQFVLRELDTHARSEDEVLYEAVENCQGVPGAVDTMRRDHVEINRLAAELSDLHGSLVIGHELSDETTRALRRVLYGLHAIVRLHFEKEEEILTPYLEHKLPAAEQERVLARLRSVAA